MASIVFSLHKIPLRHEIDQEIATEKEKKGKTVKTDIYKSTIFLMK
jgi:hypothetical protein